MIAFIFIFIIWLHNKLSQPGNLKQPASILLCSCGSFALWVLRLGSHQAAGKVSAGLSSHLEARVGQNQLGLSLGPVATYSSLSCKVT